MQSKYVLISDFDGTISDDDFFFYLTDTFFSKDALSPWQEYLSGKRTHFSALNAMFNQLHIDEKTLKDFIKTIKVDDNFFKTAELCSLKDIPVYICSAGCDYYIKELIGDKIKKYKIKLITNKGTYSKEKGLNMKAVPKTSPYYDEKIGISKKSIVKKLQDEGYQTIYAGDGPPDVAPARIADYVFAKKFLLEQCKTEKIKYKKFKNFNDVYNFIKGLKHV